MASASITRICVSGSSSGTSPGARHHHAEDAGLYRWRNSAACLNLVARRPDLLAEPDRGVQNRRVLLRCSAGVCHWQPFHGVILWRSELCSLERPTGRHCPDICPVAAPGQYVRSRISSVYKCRFNGILQFRCRQAPFVGCRASIAAISPAIGAGYCRGKSCLPGGAEFGGFTLNEGSALSCEFLTVPSLELDREFQ